MKKNKSQENCRVTFYLKKDLARRLKVFAATNDTTMTDIIQPLIESYLKKHDKKGDI